MHCVRTRATTSTHPLHPVLIQPSLVLPVWVKTMRGVAQALLTTNGTRSEMNTGVQTSMAMNRDDRVTYQRVRNKNLHFHGSSLVDDQKNSVWWRCPHPRQSPKRKIEWPSRNSFTTISSSLGHPPSQEQRRFQSLRKPDRDTMRCSLRVVRDGSWAPDHAAEVRKRYDNTICERLEQIINDASRKTCSKDSTVINPGYTIYQGKRL